MSNQDMFFNVQLQNVYKPIVHKSHQDMFFKQIPKKKVYASPIKLCFSMSY